jgi:shikimate dehydrogenase
VTGQATPRSWLAGLIGHGVGPSLTPELHEREAQRQGLRYVYKVVELPAGSLDTLRLERLLAGAIELGFDGLNVTHPVKQAMVPLVDYRDSAVEAIGALNTVLIRGGRTTGHNTDVTGFFKAFELGLPDVDRDRVVLLGAGGAGTAVAHALVQLGVKQLLVVDPDHERAEALRRSLSALPIQVGLAPVSRAGRADALATSSGVVNASPMGMAAHPGSPVPEGLLRPDLWLADIVYRPIDTPLLRAAREAGCTVLNGAGMAVHQAADAFELITGCRADRAAMTRDFDDLVAAEATRGPSAMDPPGDNTDERNSS